MFLFFFVCFSSSFCPPPAHVHHDAPVWQPAASAAKPTVAAAPKTRPNATLAATTAPARRPAPSTASSSDKKPTAGAAAKVPLAAGGAKRPPAAPASRLTSSATSAATRDVKPKVSCSGRSHHRQDLPVTQSAAPTWHLGKKQLCGG